MKTPKLRPGARKLKTKIRATIGHWVEMQYDAELRRRGLTWLRVVGGFSGDNRREDWVASVPSGCLSVNAKDIGRIRFEAALDREVKNNIADLRRKVREEKRELENAKTALLMLQRAL